MRWAYAYSESQNRYFVTDAEGFLVISSGLSLETAQRVVRLHNQEADQLATLAAVAADAAYMLENIAKARELPPFADAQQQYVAMGRRLAVAALDSVVRYHDVDASS